MVDLFRQSDIEDAIVDLFEKEIISKNLERQFESFMKTNDFSNDDLRVTNRIKELIQQRNIDIFEQQIFKKQTDLEALQYEGERRCRSVAKDALSLKVKF